MNSYWYLMSHVSSFQVIRCVSEELCLPTRQGGQTCSPLRSMLVHRAIHLPLSQLLPYHLLRVMALTHSRAIQCHNRSTPLRTHQISLPTCPVDQQRKKAAGASGSH